MGVRGDWRMGISQVTQAVRAARKVEVMRTNDIIEGLQILQKYRDKPDGYSVGAEHDILYAYETDRPVEVEDLKRLIELGWFQEDVDCGDDKFSIEHYQSDEGWAAFV